MIVTVNYGMGNLRSIEKALDRIGADFMVSSKVRDIESASHIIIPGVGFFDTAMKNLDSLGLIDVIKKEAMRKPILGICLGMQLLFKFSEEGGNIKGLGLIDGVVKRFNVAKKFKVPHVGWNNVSCNKPRMALFDNVEDDTNFYFVHSYHADLHEDVAHATTDYGYDFVSAVQKDNIFGTQFHPEKSQKKGLTILKNFAQIEVQDAKD